MTSAPKITDWEDLPKVASQMLIPGVSNHQVIDLYNQWANKGYDHHVVPGFTIPQLIMVEAIQEVFPSNRNKAVILDVGSGTGITGQHLHDTGFTTLDALDPAEAMLRVAESKHVYRNLFQFGMTAEPTTIAADSYDAIVIVGAVGHGHIPCAAFEEMTRVVKPGGYILNCMRKAYLQEMADYIQHWQPMIDRMQREGRWEVLKMDTYENHFVGKDGLLTVFKVLK